MRTKSVLFEYAGLAVLAAGSVSLFQFYGGFHFQAAILLGIGFSIVAVWLNILRQFATFKPYCLSIGINYQAVWEDLKRSPGECPEYENFSFTAISPAIFARSDELGYSRTLTLHKPIPCSADTWSAGPGEIISGPFFFFRPCIDGYQFGLRVQSRWWEAHRHQFAAPFRERALNSSNELVLGLLPYGYMPEHIRRWNEPVSLWYGFDWKQRRWKRALQKQEWTLDDDYPTRIYHRYVGVGYSEI